MIMHGGMVMEKKEKTINTSTNLRVVTSNDFIFAKEFSSLNIKSRKLLYLTIAQSRMNDDHFYEYEIPIPTFARLMNIDTSNVYQDAQKITGSLFGSYLSIKEKGSKGYKQYGIVSSCYYDNTRGVLQVRLNQELTSFLLGLKGSFTQPLLEDFMQMRSNYSISIWHLMQKEMHSKKPGPEDVVKFTITLNDLREITGTQKKFVQIGEFKKKVLDRAINEIKNNCGVVITYENIKDGRKIQRFEFTATALHHIDPSQFDISFIEAVDRKVKTINEKIKKREELT